MFYANGLDVASMVLEACLRVLGKEQLHHHLIQTLGQDLLDWFK